MANDAGQDIRLANYSQVGLAGQVQGTLIVPHRPNDWGILVLGGSSGRVDVGRALLFADLRRHRCKRIAIVGTSKGAEAALLTAIHDERVEAVFAISPTSVTWGNIGPGHDGVAWPERSSWTWNGKPLPFVPAVPCWQPKHQDGLISYRGLFERCLEQSPDHLPAATIPVELTAARLVVIAGGRDALWPSDVFAQSIIQRRQMFGMQADLIYDPEAGHRVLLPGETTPKSALHAHGGNDEADARLGKAAWAVITQVLRS
ncbi:acyl-CoA thioester hydrolase/BAAT C-terminal domain-containing protein [Rhizobium sp. 25PS6]|uniref:acyl-CoA thioester hydrolase/BAAT C-terminal domain-containing protein n=1 Tax=Rhizobium sp. 25PS6 TaxID=3075622 RepID=UPI0028FD140F|nr:acyl-CoA thioester hydrolase/BAAT C-terminal domain-containing protein [Rhizobium sp. 25PS6]MDU0359811.1 acyl-CoA thioester hydrolase/BAAT C-terminal domain-containing protein [Rhizobium sp. 25PS6]